MAYRGIDRKRLEFLLRLGTNDSELRRFFTDCRLPLINGGGKVQNLPFGFNARIRKLAELPPLTDKVVKNWFAKHVTMVDPATSEEVLQEFIIYEELDEHLSETSARRLSRSCLVHLFSDDPPELLLDFLKTSIGGQIKEREDVVGICSDLPDLMPSEPAYPKNLPHVLIDLIEGRDADEHLEGFSPELAAFIVGLQSARQGNTKEVKDVADVLSANCMLHNLFEQFVTLQLSRLASNETSARGLRIIDPGMFQGEFAIETNEVLAYCTKSDKKSAVFVNPLAVIVDSQIQLLTNERKRELFPETGDIMAFDRAGYPKQPTRGQIGVWRVAEHETDKATHFHLVSEVRVVYEVRTVPFSSTDYDSVREFLKEYSERLDGSLQPLLFKLDDGLIVGARSERTEVLSKDETYELGLRSWTVLSAIRLEGCLYVVGPLPKEQGIYDCASLGSAVRKLFKGGKSGLAQSQIKELAQSLGTQEIQADALRIQRIKSQIERLSEQKEAFDSLVNELMDNPCVIERIARLVEQEAMRQIANKTSLKTDITKLQKERDEWEERIRKKREEYRKLLDEVSKAVKTRFDKARADGLGTLADLAIFQALLAPVQAKGAISDGRSDNRGPFAEPIVRELSTSCSDAVSILKSYGVSAKHATSLNLVCETAFRAGLMVSVRGVAARPLVEGWARTLKCRSILIDLTVGLIDDATVRDVLARVPSPGVVTLLDANLSALDIYAKSLSDLVLARVAEPTASLQPSIFLTLTDGIAALPLPRTFERISINIDLDAHCVFRSAAEVDDLMSDMFNPDDGVFYQSMWRPAVDRLRVQISELEPERQALVLSVLAP